MLFFFFPLCVFAKNPEVFDHPLSAETLPRYTAICEELSGRRYMTGSFTQERTIARLNRTLVSSGMFLLDSRRGMVWDTRSPFPSVLTVGRDFILQSLPDGTRSRLSAGGNELFLGIADTISSLFTGNAGKLRERFTLFFTETGTGAGQNWTMGLIPKEAAFRSFAERIVIEGEAGGTAPVLIRSIVMYDQGGGGVRYVLSAHRFPPALEAHEEALFSPE
jgi:hypothetical protein